MSVAVSTPITEAYLSALSDIDHPAGGKVKIGDATRPDGPQPGPKSFYPYGVLYVGTTVMQGTLVQPREDGLHRVQVTSIGLDRAGAEWLRDQVRPILLDTTVDIDGYAVVYSALVTSMPVTRDTDVTPHLFYAVDVVNVFATPAETGS